MKDNTWYSYNEIADELIAYLIEYGYNYVEFMPLSEHPFDGSWGYQNTGFYAPTSRYGTAAQLMELIDKLHNAGIGAIMDFVPVHFAVDAYGLKEYDGTALYEYPHKDVGESEWGSFNFTHSRREVACFLQSAANYWLKEYHIDGLRMDAVSRLIYWQGITFSIFYAYNERYILPFSHDEVVHGKKTIIDKLHGSYEQKFAQARLLYLYMMTHPGKKLNFMGNELGIFREWDEKREPDWELLKMPAHDSFHRYILELNKIYLKKAAIWELDHTYEGFKWVDCKSDNKCVFAYTRTTKKNTVFAVFNFSDKEATIEPKLNGNLTMLLNTDWELFGGQTAKSMKKSLMKNIPPFTGLLYTYQKASESE